MDDGTESKFDHPRVESDVTRGSVISGDSELENIFAEGNELSQSECEAEATQFLEGIEAVEDEGEDAIPSVKRTSDTTTKDFVLSDLTEVLPDYGRGYKDPRDALIRLSARHRAMMNYFLAGWTCAEIGQKFGLAAQSVSLIHRSPLFQQELARRQREIDRRFSDTELGTVVDAKLLLQAECVKAAEKLLDLSQSGDDKIALAAVNSILDRCFVKTKDEEKPKAGLSLNDAQIQNLQIILQESKGGTVAA